jgi:hypothetical protein
MKDYGFVIYTLISIGLTFSFMIVSAPQKTVSAVLALSDPVGFGASSLVNPVSVTGLFFIVVHVVLNLRHGYFLPTIS